MAMSSGVRGNGPLADINVTPMADIMIVLLIIFMVMTPFLAGSPVPLPIARNADGQEGEELKVVVRAGGAITVGETTFADAAALAGFLDQRWRPGSLVSVLVQGHRDVPYADISFVLDVCRRAGAAEVRLATAPALHE
jgi:biopolymer transport protein TolR